MKSLHLAIAACLLMTGAAAAEYQQIEVPIGHNGTNGTLHLYLFDTRRMAVKIIDQGGIETQAYKNLDQAMKAHNCVAGCNGGFFGRDGNPLGLVIADGKKSGAPNRNSDLTSGVLFQDGARLRIVRAASYFSNSGNQPHQLLQAGPFLVENGKPANGLSARKHARRTFIFTDGGNHWAIGYAPATDLETLAKALSDPKLFTVFKVQTALNLDGGSSSGLWIKREHHPFYLHEIRPVRNFIGLLRR